MLTPADLLDMHRRVHHGNVNLLDHCRQLTSDELHRELPGLGFPTVARLLYHLIESEKYWLMVLRRRFDAGAELTEQEKHDWTAANFGTIDALEDFRRRAAADMEDYLRHSTPESLAATAQYAIEPGIEEPLTPVHAIMRVLTHYFHHRGLAAAMCRMLGCCVPEGYAFLDYPLAADAPYGGINLPGADTGTPG